MPRLLECKLCGSQFEEDREHPKRRTCPTCLEEKKFARRQKERLRIAEKRSRGETVETQILREKPLSPQEQLEFFEKSLNKEKPLKPLYKPDRSLNLWGKKEEETEEYPYSKFCRKCSCEPCQCQRK